MPESLQISRSDSRPRDVNHHFAVLGQRFISICEISVNPPLQRDVQITYSFLYMFLIAKIWKYLFTCKQIKKKMDVNRESISILT